METRGITTLFEKAKNFILNWLYEQVIAEHLTIDEVAGIKDLFDKLDVQKKGEITLDELKDGLRKQGHDITDSDARALMDAVSTNILFAKFYHTISYWSPIWVSFSYILSVVLLMEHHANTELNRQGLLQTSKAVVFSL